MKWKNCKANTALCLDINQIIFGAKVLYDILLIPYQHGVSFRRHTACLCSRDLLWPMWVLLLISKVVDWLPKQLSRAGNLHVCQFSGLIALQSLNRRWHSSALELGFKDYFKNLHRSKYLGFKFVK